MPLPYVLRRAQERCSVERLLERAEYLDPPERLLLEQILCGGVAVEHLARLAGTEPRKLQRKVRRLIAALGHPNAEWIVRHGHKLAGLQRQIAIRLWMQGLSLRQTARRLDLSLHDVRQHAQVINGLLSAAQARAAGGSDEALGRRGMWPGRMSGGRGG